MKSVSYALTTLRIMALGFVLATTLGLGTSGTASSLRHAAPALTAGQQVADSNGQETHGKNDPKGPSGKRFISLS